LDVTLACEPKEISAAPSSKMVSINQTVAAIHSIKTRGPRRTANLNNGECYATCRHTKLNKKKLCALSDKLMFRCMCNAER